MKPGQKDDTLRFAEFLRDQQIVKPRAFIRKPTVSVIMPTYCRAHDGLLSRAIASVLSQTFSDFEFIIMDDGSTDGSEDIIREFQKQDDRILYIRHEVNSGLPALRADEGFLLSRGDYIAIQLDDDEWLPQFLQTVVRQAIAKDLLFVHCQAEFFLYGQLYWSPFPVMQPTYISLMQGNKIGANSALVHRSVLHEIGLWDPHVVLRRITDWDLWLRIARRTPPYMVREVLVRGHGGLPDSIGARASMIEYEDYLLMLELSRDADLTPERILDYEVMSLNRYGSLLSVDTISMLYQDMVLPWLKQYEGQFAKLGIVTEGMRAGEVNNVKKNEKKELGYINKSGMRLRRDVLVNRALEILREQAISLKAKIRRIVERLLIFKIFGWLIFWPIVRLFNLDAESADIDWIAGDPLEADHRTTGFLLKRSVNLQDVSSLFYSIIVREGSVCAMSLAFTADADMADVKGSVGVDIVSRQNRVVASVRISAAYACSHKRTEFWFEPPINEGLYTLGISGKRLSAPVFVYELSKCGGMLRRPLCRLMYT